MNPCEKLTEGEVKSLKADLTGFFTFFCSVIVSVAGVLLILHFVYGVI